ncbi:MAG: hypothetical protein M3T96_00670 [Acidobacteriota bacterium]|nr:hypothetical protein [Acidobacteriota bacterium]
MFQLGNFVEFDGLLAVVVGLAGEGNIPENHLAIWFGEPQRKRISQGGNGDLVPIVWTVPAEYCVPAKSPELRH